MKRIISLFLLASIVATMLTGSVFAYTAEDMESDGATTVVCLSDNFDTTAIEQVEEGVSAYIVDDAGNTFPLNCEVTISEVPQTMSATSPEGPRYSMKVSTEVKTKYNDDTLEMSSVICYVEMYMDWIDGPGIYNSIERLRGECTMVKGTLQKARVSWGNAHNRCVKYKILDGNELAFDFDPDFDVGTGEGIPISGNLHAHYEAVFVKGGQYYLVVCVNPNIFD